MNQAPPSEPEPGIGWKRGLRTLTAACLLFVGVGLLGALIWSRVTNSPGYRLINGRPALDELALGESFNADGTFLLVAGALGLVAGAVTAALFARHGVVTVLSVVAGAALACLTMNQLGTMWGPAPLAEQAAEAGPGAVLPSPLAVEAAGVFFSWPIGALAGAFVSLLVFAPRPKPLPPDPQWGSV